MAVVSLLDMLTCLPAVTAVESSIYSESSQIRLLKSKEDTLCNTPTDYATVQNTSRGLFSQPRAVATSISFERL